MVSFQNAKKDIVLFLNCPLIRRYHLKQRRKEIPVVVKRANITRGI